MKKLFLAVTFAIVALFSANPISEAKDVWVYTDQMGSEYYVMDETIGNRSSYTGGRSIYARVKYIDNAMETSKTHIDDYLIVNNNGSFTCKRNGMNCPVYSAQVAIWEFCAKYLGI